MTTHHYSTAGTLAVCGQLADGVDHTTHDADTIHAIWGAQGRGVCLACLAVAGGASPVDDADLLAALAEMQPLPRCPVGTPWCIDHLREGGGEQCVSRSIDVSPRLSVWLTQEPGMEAPLVEVDGSHATEISLAEARELVEGLSALLEEVER